MRTISQFAGKVAKATNGLVLEVTEMGATIQTHNGEKVTLPGHQSSSIWREQNERLLKYRRLLASRFAFAIYR